MYVGWPLTLILLVLALKFVLFSLLGNFELRIGTFIVSFESSQWEDFLQLIIWAAVYGLYWLTCIKTFGEWRDGRH